MKLMISTMKQAAGLFCNHDKPSDRTNTTSKVSLAMGWHLSWSFDMALFLTKQMAPHNGMCCGRGHHIPVTLTVESNPHERY